MDVPEVRLQVLTLKNLICSQVLRGARNTRSIEKSRKCREHWVAELASAEMNSNYR